MIRRRIQRRRRSAHGFTIAEALVSLAIAALTLVLLTSATWGLRQLNETRAAQGPVAADWLTARRALQAWAAAASTDGSDSALGRFQGDSTSVRLYVPPTSAGPSRPYVSELRVTAKDGLYTLSAHRDRTVTDTRMKGNSVQSTEILATTEPIRLMYLMRSRTGPGRSWFFATEPEDGLPFAIAVEVDGNHLITAPIMSTVSATCAARNGLSALGDQECKTR